MSVSKDTNQQESVNTATKVRERKAASSRKSNAKKEGTRVGVLEDFRGAGKGKGGVDSGRRNRLRDGK